MNLGDHHERVRPEGDNLQDARPVDQIVIRDLRGQEHVFELHPAMQPVQLKRHVVSKGVTDFQKAWLHCDEQHWEKYISLVKMVWPNAKLEELPATEPGSYRARGRARFTINEHYFRAIAKIGFHYYLAHSRRGVRGDEPGFSEIRKFIMDGGEIGRFFNSSERTFAPPFAKLPTGEILRCHVLAADERADVAVAYVHMFVGPRVECPRHYITLGSLDSRIEVPTYVWAHVYVYDDQQPDKGYAGTVKPARLRHQ